MAIHFLLDSCPHKKNLLSQEASLLTSWMTHLYLGRNPFILDWYIVRMQETKCSFYPYFTNNKTINIKIGLHLFIFDTLHHWYNKNTNKKPVANIPSNILHHSLYCSNLFLHENDVARGLLLPVSLWKYQRCRESASITVD